MVIVYLLLSLCILYVNPMAINGPVLTRYQPCALGVILFDKVTDLLWRAELNLGLYRGLKAVEIEIVFEKQMNFHGVSHNSTVIIGNNAHNFTFIPKGDVPVIYHVYLSVNGHTAGEIPPMKTFRLNKLLMCNESNKNDGMLDSFDTLVLDNADPRHVCGRRSLRHSEVNSMRTDAEPGDWPWHVALLIKSPHTNLASYQCGGNVISKTAILTAGHCVFLNDTLVETKRIIVVAGVTNLIDMNQPGKQVLIAERVILHPDYSIKRATSDLAIVVVNMLRYTEYVQPICVWGPTYDKTALFGKQAVITGFGTTEKNVLSNTLRSTNIMVQNDTTCIAYDSHLYSELLNEFTFCAGFGPNAGINPRNGDSGGGLIVPTMQGDHKVSWFLRGILSKCGLPTGALICDPKYYVIYTDIGPHFGWIYHNAGVWISSNAI